MKKLLSSALLMVLSFSAYSATFNADDVIRKNIATTKGFGDSIETMKMVIYSQSGDKVERVMTSKVFEVADDGDKQMITFENPADVRGSAVLTHTKVVGNDDQWIYLPAVRRAKRISSANKSGPFMGSEFAYEDLGSSEFGKFTYEPVGTEDVDGMSFFKVKRTPTYERSGYSNQVVWIDAQSYLIRKIDMYDNAGQLYKTELMTDYKNFFDNYWRPGKIVMVNHKNNRKTEMYLSENIKFRNGFSEREFERNAMGR